MTIKELKQLFKAGQAYAFDAKRLKAVRRSRTLTIYHYHKPSVGQVVVCGSAR